MKFSRVILGLIVVLNIAVMGQIDKKKIRGKVFDAITEVSENQLVLRFYNALDGEPIEGAAITFSGMEVLVTDFEGRAFFNIPEDGVYQFVFKHPKFIKSTFEIEIAAGTLIFNRFSVSPLMPIGTLRVVLDWGKNPADLDAHLVKVDDYHISYRNKKIAADGAAKLDRDDRDSFGPETITVRKVDQRAVYKYFVYDFTNRSKDNSMDLARSNATVKVYGGNNELLKVFKVPENKIGKQWDIFEIVNGKIQE